MLDDGDLILTVRMNKFLSVPITALFYLILMETSKVGIFIFPFYIKGFQEPCSKSHSSQMIAYGLDINSA